jgi:hypothetical protein
VAVERDGPSAMSAGGWKLSFQSKRGFESLGYAAAIEWINERAGRFEGTSPGATRSPAQPANATISDSGKIGSPFACSLRSSDGDCAAVFSDIGSRPVCFSARAPRRGPEGHITDPRQPGLGHGAA